MRAPVLLLLPLAACATQPVSRPPAQPTPRAQTASSSPAAAPAQRWRAVPAKADGSQVPGGRRHLVKPGETGIAIARAYAVPWSRIAEANRIPRDSTLEVGQRLFIPTTPGRAASRPRPAAPPREPATPEERAAAFSIDVDDLITGSAEARPRTPAPAAVTPRAPATIPPLGWPVDGRVILSAFGPKPNGRVNDGITIKTLRGATVRAAADGQVIYVGDAVPGLGLMVLIRHGPPGPDAVVTAYGHLEDALVNRGDRIPRGQPIARAGTSGNAREPQLLFQLRQGRRALNPIGFLTR